LVNEKVPPKENLIVKSSIIIADLPHEILENIISFVAGDPDRDWEIRDDHDFSMRRMLFDPAPTNDILNLIQVSRRLNQLAGAALYCRLNRRDVNEGALDVMSERKVDHLMRGESITKTYYDLRHGSGSFEYDGSQAPVRDVQLKVFGAKMQSHSVFTSCHPAYCASTRQYIPQTLVFWQKEYRRYHDQWSSLFAKYCYPLPIKKLVVHVGKPSLWEDDGSDIRTAQTWVKSLVPSESVVFIIDNPYVCNTSKEGRMRDMRYNPEDNLHPWVSIFMRTLLEYSLGNNAKDITVVNIGSIRSEMLGLAENFYKIEADFKCERCHTERELEKLFMLEYGKRLSGQTGSEIRPIAKVKFVPFSEYLDTYDWKGTVLRVDERYYIHEYDERRYVKGRGYIRRTCHKCDYPEEELDIKCVCFASIMSRD